MEERGREKEATPAPPALSVYEKFLQDRKEKEKNKPKSKPKSSYTTPFFPHVTFPCFLSLNPTDIYEIFFVDAFIHN